MGEKFISVGMEDRDLCGVFWILRFWASMVLCIDAI